MPKGDSERTIAECSNCGNTYAAEEWSGGAIQPIGAKNGCPGCGSTEFQVIEDTSAIDFHED